MIPPFKAESPTSPAPAASLAFAFGTANQTPASEKRGVIYTFYSFKGGVGRSMALANVAALLAKWGYSVLVVDWDVEAPGIEHFFARDNPSIYEDRSDTPGVLDLMQAKRDGKPLHWRDCLVDVKIGSHSLALLTAGRSGQHYADYTARLHALSFPELFDKHDLGAYIEDLRDQWALEFQFVLVDSRTGVTDIGGICSVHLADVLVLLFTTTESSADGALEILERARKAQELLPRDRKRLFAVPVPSRDESRTEYERATQWKDRFAEQFGELYRDWLPSGIEPREAIEKLRIPYVPYWSFGERLPVIEEGTTDPSSLGYSYQVLARLLATRLDWYKAIEGHTSAPPPVAKLRELDGNWLAKHRKAAQTGLTAAGLTGFMEICHFCLDPAPEKSQRELLLAATQARVTQSSWPIGVVLNSREEFRPRPASDGILAKIDAGPPFEHGRIVDYWTLSRSGDFYTLVTLAEDRADKTRAGKFVFFDTRIACATELILHCANLYRVLGFGPSVGIELIVRYGGLLGRTLTAASAGRRNFPQYKDLLEDQVTIPPMTFQLGAIEDEVVDLVEKLCAPLFVIFDFAEFRDEDYRQIVTDFVTGKVSA